MLRQNKGAAKGLLRIMAASATESGCAASAIGVKKACRGARGACRRDGEDRLVLAREHEATP
jgi:hypothetical protein